MVQRKLSIQSKNVFLGATTFSRTTQSILSLFATLGITALNMVLLCWKSRLHFCQFSTQKTLKARQIHMLTYINKKSCDYRILSSIVCTFLHWKWCQHIPCALYIGWWLRRGLRWLLWWINLQRFNSCKIIHEIIYIFLSKKHCEMQVHTIIVCTLYSIKYGTPHCWTNCFI
jgi:hypothetical protein